MGALLLVATASTAWAQTQTVTASWDRNQDSYTVGYRLYYGTAPGTYSQSIDVGNVLSRDVTVAQGSTYYFVVRAYNSADQLGPASEERSIDLNSTPTPPTATLTATVDAENRATVTWATTNATSVTLDGASVALSGSRVDTLTATRTYTLVATGPGGSVTRTATATISTSALPTATLTATVDAQNRATITWTTTNATRATLDDNQVPLNWSVVVRLTTSRTFTLVATGPGGSVTRTATATISNSSEPTATLTATVDAQNRATVTWATTDATSVTLDGASVALSGSRVDTLTATRTYTLVATGPGGSVTRTATATISTSVLPTATLTGTVDARNRATLTWATTNATRVTLNNNEVALSGSVVVRLNRSRTFTLVATGPGGSVSRSLTLSPNTTLSANIAPSASLTGVGTGADRANLSWRTSNATSVTLNGRKVALNGWTTDTISTATDYTLIATGPDGQVSVSTTVDPASSPADADEAAADCAASDWSFQNATVWSACTGGQRTRTETWTREVVTGTLTEGLACGPLVEERTAAEACESSSLAPPDPPVDVRASVSGNTATLRWSPAATGGSATAYTASVGTALGASDVADDLPLGAGLHASGALPPGHYYVRVKGINAAGASAASGDVEFDVGASSVPRAPGALTASMENGVVTLAWAAPIEPPGNAPTGYVVEAGSAPGQSDLAVMPLAEVTSLQVRAPSGRYHVRVRARNERGTGKPSREVVIDPQASSPAPAALTVTGEGAIVTLNWVGPPAGDLPVGYLVEVGTGPGLANLAVLRAGRDTTFSTTIPPGRCFVRVRGVAADGTAGAASNEIAIER